MLENIGMTCFFFFYLAGYRLIDYFIIFTYAVCRWAVERLHFGWSWQQSRDRPGTQPLTFIQSKSPVTAGPSQPDRRS